MLPPHPTPAERFATILLWLGRAIVARQAFGLPAPLISLIIGRIRDINQRFARLAALVAAGRYTPRRRSAPRSPAARQPRQPNPLPQTVGWLLKLVPEAVGYRSQLEYLLRDEAMAALLATAPASLSRPIRSLCRMLRLDPPKILAPPPSARPQTPSPKAGPPPAPQRRPEPERPRYVFGLRDPPPLRNPV